MSEKISEKTYNKLLSDQQDEITAHYLYHKIADFVKDKENKEIIRQVAEDELKHYNQLKEITGKELKPERFKIFLFNYYISVAKDYNFKKRFGEMAAISLGVAGISFLIGVLIKQFIGVDI